MADEKLNTGPGEEMSRYSIYMSTLGNRPDLFPDSPYVDKYIGYGPFLLRDKVSRGGGILVVPPGQRYNIDVM